MSKLKILLAIVPVVLALLLSSCGEKTIIARRLLKAAPSNLLHRQRKRRRQPVRTPAQAVNKIRKQAKQKPAVRYLKRIQAAARKHPATAHLHIKALTIPGLSRLKNQKPKLSQAKTITVRVQNRILFSRPQRCPTVRKS